MPLTRSSRYFDRKAQGRKSSIAQRRWHELYDHERGVDTVQAVGSQRRQQTLGPSREDFFGEAYDTQLSTGEEVGDDWWRRRRRHVGRCGRGWVFLAVTVAALCSR